jgi:hypothetical protein
MAWELAILFAYFVIDLLVRRREMSQAKDRMYRRIEKVLLTFECILVSAFVGICVSFFWGTSEGAVVAIWTFALAYARKRYLIYKERK